MVNHQRNLRCALAHSSVFALAVLLASVVAFAHAEPIRHPAPGLWFRGGRAQAINAEEQLLSEFGTSEAVKRSFDKLVGKAVSEHPGSFSNLRISTHRIQFVVKRSTVADVQWLDALREIVGHGAHLEYFPDNGALVYTDIHAARRIASLPDTKFVVPVQPEWKAAVQIPVLDYVDESARSATQVLLTRSDIKGDLHKLSEESKSVRQILNQKVLLSISVANHPQELGIRSFAASLVDSSISQGFEVHIVDINEVTNEIVVSVPKASVRPLVSKLVRINRVLGVFEKPRSHVMNSTGNNIVTSGNPNVTNPFAGLLNGTGEIIHIADSGLDFFHCFFHETSPPKTSKNMVNTTSAERNSRRKIVAYWQFMDDAWGWTDHGTHVSGTAAGAANSVSASALQSENGLASGAKIAFTDIGCQSPSGCQCGKTSTGADIPCDCGPSGCEISDTSVYVPTSLDKDLFPFGLANGAFISSNSWGGSAASYGSSSRQIDDAVNANASLLILFAAGNGGPQSVSEQAAAKNIISVGASTTGQPDFIDIVQNKYNPSQDGGHAFATSILNCTQNDPRPDCAYFLSPDFDACSLDSFCAAGYTAGFTDCGCIPCADGYCYFLGASFCSNCLVISFQNIPEEDIAPNSLAGFSSTGPTVDGRIKPDVVAPGYLIASSRSYPGSLASAPDVCGTSGLYQSFASIKPHLYATQGTSMATPLVAGYSALIREWLRNYYPNAAGNRTGATPIAIPPASLLKALIVQSATPMDGIYCSFLLDSSCFLDAPLENGHPYEQGFGRVDLRTIIPLPSAAANSTNSTSSLSGHTRVLAQEDTVLSAGNASRSFSVAVNGASTCLRATLVWTDPTPSVSASDVLVNDLDLIVSSGNGTSIRGNSQYFGGDAPDSVNNVEKVSIKTATAGTYTIVVNASRVVAPQSFSLVVSTMPSELCVDITPVDDGFSSNNDKSSSTHANTQLPTQPTSPSLLSRIASLLFLGI
eukprot:ANDGO_06644.mRNA.1 Serine protease/ABC transporter B family protein tagD